MIDTSSMNITEAVISHIPQLATIISGLMRSTGYYNNTIYADAQYDKRFMKAMELSLFDELKKRMTRPNIDHMITAVHHNRVIGVAILIPSDWPVGPVVQSSGEARSRTSDSRPARPQRKYYEPNYRGETPFYTDMIKWGSNHDVEKKITSAMKAVRHSREGNEMFYSKCSV